MWDKNRMRLSKPALAAVCLLAVSACSDAVDTVDATFVVQDDRFHEFVPEGTRIEILATDLGWAEGPVWSNKLNAVLFSDVAANTIYRWDEREGLNEFLSPSGHEPDDGPLAWRGANGLAIDAQGRLLLAQQGNRKLARMSAPLSDPAPAYEVLADAYEGKSINSPNDLVVHESGSIYFSDPPYGLDGFENSPAIELDFFGVFQLSPENDLRPVVTDLQKPNGLALSADQSTLYVSNSETGDAYIVAIELDTDGMAGDSRVFFDAAELAAEGPGSTDGMAIHPSDFLFVSVPDGLGLLSPDGELLGRIALGAVTNMAFDATFSYLYITTPSQLLRLRTGDKQ